MHWKGWNLAVRTPLPAVQVPFLPPLLLPTPLHGTSLAATQHRIKELRSLASGPLPGKSLVVYDPSLLIPIDVFPCEDGHTLLLPGKEKFSTLKGLM